MAAAAGVGMVGAATAAAAAGTSSTARAAGAGVGSMVRSGTGRGTRPGDLARRQGEEAPRLAVYSVQQDRGEAFPGGEAL